MKYSSGKGSITLLQMPHEEIQLLNVTFISSVLPLALLESIWQSWAQDTHLKELIKGEERDYQLFRKFSWQNGELQCAKR